MADIGAGIGQTFSKHASSGTLIDGTYTNLTTSTKGVQVDVTIAGGNITIDNVNSGGLGVLQNEQLTILGSQFDPDGTGGVPAGIDGVNDLVLNVDALTNANVALTIDRIEGASTM